jgi:heat shock protein HslJ
MKITYCLGILLIMLGIGLAACVPSDNAAEKTLFIGPQSVSCSGVAPQTCLLVKENQSQNYSLFYDNIQGFCYEPGYSYIITVKEESVNNPPADASSKKWTLLEVVSKTGNVTASSLEDVSWSLDSLLNIEGETVCALPSTEVTALFKNGRVSGNAGCNNYGAAYETNGDYLTIGPIMSTLMMCVDGGVSRQESDYLKALNNSASYNISGNLLRIMNSNGTVILTYSVVQPTPLVGTLWQMTSYNNGKGGLVSDLSSINTTAIFSEVGNLAGSAACNQYHTTYQVNDSQIRIGPVATTRMMCPESVMQQEMEYLNALQSAASYEIQGSDLILFNANDTKAVTYQSPG